MEFVNRFNAAIAGTGVDSIVFGKAQKIINVSLKYIYCLKGADQYLEKFRHCHMTLDRYTYTEGFYRKEVIPWYNNCYLKEHPGSKLKASDVTSWSSLEFEDYRKIQVNISNYLHNLGNVSGNGTSPTPFEAEFHIFKHYEEELKKKDT